MQTRFQVSGIEGTLEVFENLRDQIGDAKKSSNILIQSAREALKPVLSMAQSLVDQDTGMLERSLTIVARRPTRKDMQSNYVQPTDSAIALVTTRPIPKHLKRKLAGSFHASGKGKAEYRAFAKKFYKEADIFYDARAIANEYGTVNRPAKPYLRISLESQQTSVTELVAMLIRQNIENYRAKNLTK
jgi:hypothetical protein